jgi:hypothetical protein
MSAFGVEADMVFCGSPLLPSLSGVKRINSNSRERDNIVAVRQQILGIGHALGGSSLRKVISPVQHDLDETHPYDDWQKGI